MRSCKRSSQFSGAVLGVQVGSGLAFSRAETSVFAAMASLQSASARQLPGCSTTGRTHAQAQRLHYSHTVLRQSKCHAVGSSSFSSTCRDPKRCLPLKRRQACAVQTRAESTPNQEEAQLRADYGALSQRLEVSCCPIVTHSTLGQPVAVCSLDSYSYL